MHAHTHTHTHAHTHTQDVQKLMALIAKLLEWMKETPLVEESHQRFGNKAFKAWWERVRDVSSLAPLSLGSLNTVSVHCTC